MKSDFNYFDEIVPADMYSRTKATIYQNIAIFDICNLMYLSPDYFKRVFKEHTGRTPRQYLIDIRLEKAKEPLRTKKISIEDTARLCGFVNAGYFAVTFQRSTHLSPSEYRKIHSQK